jgi:hypothetical protein
MFVGKARSLPLSGASLGLALAFLTNWVERPARHKQSSLLQKLVNYGRKRFYKIGPWAWIQRPFYDILTIILKLEVHLSQRRT